MAAKKQTFEERLTALEALVKQMEMGGLTLEETLACYEKGVTLSKALESDITRAQQRLSQLKDGALAPMEDA